MEKHTNSEAPEVTREEANAIAFEEHGKGIGNATIELPSENTATQSVGAESSSESIELPSLEAPPQWRAEKKALWDQMPRELQEENIRVFKENFNGPESTQAKFHREQEAFKNEKAKYEPYERLIGEAQKLARSRGEEIPTPQQVVASIQLTNDLKGQKLSTIVDILEAQGLPVSEKLREAAESEAPENGLSEKKIAEIAKKAIQESIAPVLERQAMEDHLKYRAEMSGHWENFKAAKNEFGALKYLDIQTDEPRSLQLQAQMAHLVAGQSAQSQEFIATQRAINPNITQPELFAKAYQFYGGNVDQSSKAPNERTNLKKAHNAAASRPGQGTSGRTQESTPKGLSREQANEYAFKKMQEEGLM